MTAECWLLALPSVRLLASLGAVEVILGIVRKLPRIIGGQWGKRSKPYSPVGAVELGVFIVLFVIGWLLTRELYSNSKIEDCVMSGRTNCVPIDPNSSTY